MKPQTICDNGPAPGGTPFLPVNMGLVNNPLRSVDAKRRRSRVKPGLPAVALAVAAVLVPATAVLLPTSALLGVSVQGASSPDAPSTPTITWPPAGVTLGSNRPDIAWANAAINGYEVHIGSANDPSSSDGWDSGQVDAAASTNTAMSGPLATQRWYYVFVRLRDATGWGPWSPPGRSFYVAGQWINDPSYIDGPVGFQWPHCICYNPDRNEYLIAFADREPNRQSRISYYLLDGNGAKRTAEFTITDDDHLDGAHEAAVVYNSQHHEYFLAYTGWMNDNTPQVRDQLRGQRINSTTGALIGSSYLLYEGGDRTAMVEHRISYSPLSDACLIVWKFSIADSEILALRVNGATGIGDGLLNITAGETRYAAYPGLAWNSADDEFEVIFQVDASCDASLCATDPQCDCLTNTWCIEHGCTNNGWDYYGQRVSLKNGAMALVGGTVPLAVTSASESDGDIAYDSDLNRYLMVYQGAAGGTTIWGQFLSADGTPFGSRFPVLSSPWSGGSINLGQLPSTREYVAAWLDCCTTRNYARRISQVGALIGEPFKTTGTIIADDDDVRYGGGNWKPLPTPNPFADEFLFSWYCNRDDVYVRRYKTYPSLDVTAPAPVTNFVATPQHRQISLSWTNPGTADSLGTLIRFKIDGFPAGPHDGRPLVIKPNLPGSADSFVHSGLDRALTYYYAAFSYDGVPNHGPAATRSIRPAAPADLDLDGDVDQSDFGRFQACLSGSGVAYGPGCQDADLDGNGSVDQDDFGLFQACVSGANQPPGC
jgi:hypothetical protein